MPEQVRDAVLITRPEAGAAETAARVAALGLRPVVASLLTIRALPASLPSADRLQAVLIASANAVHGLPTAYRALPLLAVGAASAKRARDAGFFHVHSADGDADALAALASAHCDPAGAPLLLAAGRGQSLPLAAVLRASGFRVIRCATYAAVPVRALPEAAAQALRNGHLRAALFFSAETARQFVRLLVQAGLRETVGDIDACAIGEPAAAAIEALPWRRVLRAAQPTQDAMLALLMTDDDAPPRQTPLSEPSPSTVPPRVISTDPGPSPSAINAEAPPEAAPAPSPERPSPMTPQLEPPRMAVSPTSTSPADASPEAAPTAAPPAAAAPSPEPPTQAPSSPAAPLPVASPSVASPSVGSPSVASPSVSSPSVTSSVGSPSVAPPPVGSPTVSSPWSGSPTATAAQVTPTSGAAAPVTPTSAVTTQAAPPSGAVPPKRPPDPASARPAEPPPPGGRSSRLAWLVALGFLLLAGAQAALWLRVSAPSAEFGALNQRVQTLEARLAQLEQRPIPAVPDVNALTARVAALEQRAASGASPAAVPTVPSLAPLEARITTLEQRLSATTGTDDRLAARVAALEEHPTPGAGAGTPAKPSELAPLEARITSLEQRSSVSSGADDRLAARVAALEQRPAPGVAVAPPAKSSDLATLEARVAALEQRPTPVVGAPSPAKPQDLTPLEARLATLEQRTATTSDSDHGLAARLTADETMLAALDKADPARLADHAKRIARIQAAALALALGQPLGELQDAPPALTRYAAAAPPTEAALRLAFPAAARAALTADRPVATDKPVVERLWAEAQDLITIRQGEHVLVGDKAAGVLARAQTLLDVGDLGGAVAAVDSLDRPAGRAIAAWLDQAHGLLAARAALADLAAKI